MTDLFYKNLERLKNSSGVQRVQRFVPAIAFLSGFGWDSLTLGKLVNPSDLLILFVYYAVAAFCLLLLSAFDGKCLTNSGQPLFERVHQNALAIQVSKLRFKILNRSWSAATENRLTYIVQFCFGSLFSALVVCYFKSSGSVGSLCLVALLALLLLLNEFFQKRYAAFGFSLALFSLVSTMFLNFLIPHLVGQIGFVWFLLSIVCSLGITFVLYRLSHRSKKTLIVPGLISVLLVGAYVVNWIPPVPLVLKDQNACVGFQKQDYSCYVSNENIFVEYGFAPPTVHLPTGGGEVYFVSSVFAPLEVSAGLEHRWYFKNPKTGNFEQRNIITSSRMKTRGSRREGFRIYTKKKNVAEGLWKVETAVRDGAIIGSKTFYISRQGGESNRLWKIR